MRDRITTTDAISSFRHGMQRRRHEGSRGGRSSSAGCPPLVVGVLFLADRKRDTAPRFAVTDLRSGRQPGENVSNKAVARVIVIGDHSLASDGVCAIVGSFEDFEVLGQCAMMSDFVALFDDTSADVVIVCREPTDGDVLTVIDAMRDKGSDARVVVLVDPPTAQRVASSLGSGVTGILITTQSTEEIVSALRIVAAGGHAFAPRVMDVIASKPLSVDACSLSPREREVLQSVAGRGSARKAADELALSPTTVRNHLQRAIAKLGVHTTLEAVVLAIRENIIEIPEPGCRAS